MKIGWEDKLLSDLNFLGVDKSVLSKCCKNLQNSCPRFPVDIRPSGRGGDGRGPASNDLFAIYEKPGAKRPSVYQTTGADGAIRYLARRRDYFATGRYRDRYRLH
jgi:hypothetical protein